MTDTGITPLTPQQEAAVDQDAARESYLHRALVAFDVFANVLTGGEPDETISSRAARAATADRWWGIVLSKFLDLFEWDHGAKAQAADAERAETVEHIEEHSGNLPMDTKEPGKDAGCPAKK